MGSLKIQLATAEEKAKMLEGIETWANEIETDLSDAISGGENEIILTDDEPADLLDELMAANIVTEDHDTTVIEDEFCDECGELVDDCSCDEGDEDEDEDEDE